MYYIILWQQNDAKLVITDTERERTLDAESGPITSGRTTCMFYHARMEKGEEMEDALAKSKKASSNLGNIK